MLFPENEIGAFYRTLLYYEGVESFAVPKGLGDGGKSHDGGVTMAVTAQRGPAEARRRCCRSSQSPAQLAPNSWRRR